MSVMHAMLGNAAVAAVLCLLALVVGRICRSPAVRHFLWVLVLLKLITPPLFRVPLAVLPPEPLSSEFQVLSSESQQLAFSAQNSALRTRNSELSMERAPAWWKQCRVVGIDHWMFAVWIAGAAGWFLWQGRRIVRFRRWVARVETASELLQGIGRLPKP